MPPRKRSRRSSSTTRKRAKVNIETPDPVALLSSIQVELPKQHPALFTVGGKIDLSRTDPEIDETRDPVTIRWDSGPKGDRVRKISLPLNDTRADQTRFRQLVNDCGPTMFSRSQKDHCKASKMDVQRFSSDYSPDDNHVIGKIIQTLTFPDTMNNTYRGVRAELSALNVSILRIDHQVLHDF